MLEDEEVYEEKDYPLETCPDLQNVHKLLKYVVFDLHNFYEAAKLRHPDQLVHLPQARKSSELVDIPRIIQRVQRDHRDQIQQEPAGEVLDTDYLAISLRLTEVLP